MRSFVFFVLASFFVSSLFAGGESTSRSMEASETVWNLYTSLYHNQHLDPSRRAHFEKVAKETWSSKTARVNALIHLPQPTSEKTSYDNIVTHMIDLYAEHTEDRSVFALAGNDHFVPFLVLADQLDGKVDAHLGLPDLAGLYDLFVTRKTPMAAIGYNHRENETWVDRRSLIDFNKLERELPKSLRKLRGSKVGDDKKLARIMDYVRKNVVAVDDGWDADLWQTPVETLLVGEGDCEDFAILFHAIASWMGVETRITLGFALLPGAAVMPEGNGHAWIEYDGKIIDPISPDIRGAQYKPVVYFDAEHASFANDGTHFGNIVAAK